MEGLSINNGFPSKDFLCENEDLLEFKECLIVVCSEKIFTMESLIRILEFSKNTNKSLIIFSPNVCSEAQSMLLYNKRKNNINVKIKVKFFSV